MKYLIDAYGAMLLKAVAVHLGYVLVSVAIGFALGLVLGVLLSRVPRWSGIVLPILSVFQTIPGLVFIGVLFIWWGMVPATVIVALTVYAMFPVLKNTYTGILAVESRYVEAAKGCGMSPLQTLLQVELPLAMPSIVAGLRMAAIYTVSWAASFTRAPTPTTTPSFCWERSRRRCWPFCLGGWWTCCRRRSRPGECERRVENDLVDDF